MAAMWKCTLRKDITLKSAFSSITQALEATCKHPNDVGGLDALKQIAGVLLVSVDEDSPRPLQQPTPKEWRELVDTKVPLRLASLLITLRGNPAASEHQHYAITALMEFIRAVFKSCPPGSSTTGTAGASQGGGNNLQAKIKQQLEQAGLLQHLPSVLESTTAQLIASASEAERETDPAKRVPPTDNVVRTTGAPTPTLTLQAIALLRLHSVLFELWPFSSFRERPVGLFSTAAATVQLAAALMSRCGWACGGMPAPKLPAQAVRKLLPLFVLDVTRATSQACLTMKAAARLREEHGWSGPQVSAGLKLQKSHTLLCLVAAAVTTLLCRAISDAPTGSNTANSSSHSNGGSSSSKPTPMLLLQPTPVLQQLFECFGIDNITALCAGRVMQYNRTFTSTYSVSTAIQKGITEMLDDYSSICSAWLDSTYQLAVNSQVRQLLMLLPVLILHWATSLPAPQPGEPRALNGYLACCKAAASACYRSISVVCAFNFRATLVGGNAASSTAWDAGRSASGTVPDAVMGANNAASGTALGAGDAAAGTALGESSSASGTASGTGDAASATLSASVDSATRNAAPAEINLRPADTQLSDCLAEVMPLLLALAENINRQMPDPVAVVSAFAANLAPQAAGSSSNSSSSDAGGSRGAMAAGSSSSSGSSAGSDVAALSASSAPDRMVVLAPDSIVVLAIQTTAQDATWYALQSVGMLLTQGLGEFCTSSLDGGAVLAAPPTAGSSDSSSSGGSTNSPADAAVACGNPAAPYTLQLLQAWEAFTRYAVGFVAAAASALPDNLAAGLIDTQGIAPTLQYMPMLLRAPATPFTASLCAASPSNPECKQCFSLLASLLKLSRAGRPACGPGTAEMMAEAASSVRMTAMVAAAALLQRSLSSIAQAVSKDPDGEDVGAAAGGATTAAGSTSTTTAPSTQSMAASAAAEGQLPALFLFGQYCLLVAQLHLASWVGLPAAAAAAAAAVPAAGTGSEGSGSAGSVGRTDSGSSSVIATPGGADPPLVYHKLISYLKGYTRSLWGSVQAPMLSQQLSAVGCNPQQLLGHLQRLLAALGDVGSCSSTHSSAHSSSEGREDPDDVGAALQLQLQSTGQALTLIPVSCCCNNPTCGNTSGRSEQDLVSGRSCVCGGCRLARYCSRQCQRAHWKHHKPVCKAAAAAAAAAEQG